MNCARCGEQITAPYYFDGKYYGWTCIKIVNPHAKRAQKENVVLADSFAIEQITKTKSKITAVYNGKKYRDFLFDGINGPIKVIGNSAFIETRLIN